MLTGFFVELMAGSGKTFAIALAVIWFVKIEKRKVHVATFTQYLSSRDLNELNPFYRFLNISASSVAEAKYETSQVIYGNISDFAFNYLHLSNNVKRIENIRKNFLDVMILDESDGILVEKDLTSHIISTNLKMSDTNFIINNKVLDISMEKLKELIHYVEKNFVKQVDYFFTNEVDKSNNDVQILEKGIAKIQEIYKEKELSFMHHYPSSLFFLIKSILKSMMKKENVDYIKHFDDEQQKLKISIINSYTGEKDYYSRYASFEHEILEIKNNVIEVNNDSLIKSHKFSSSLNIYTYLRLYKMCVGVSGTNLEIKELIESLFNRKTLAATQTFKNQRKDIYLNCFENLEHKVNYLVKKVKEYFPRPILILSENVESNSFINEKLMKKIPFLNRFNLFPLTVLNEEKKQ